MRTREYVDGYWSVDQVKLIELLKLIVSMQRKKESCSDCRYFLQQINKTTLIMQTPILSSLMQNAN
jgi:hypothetical protein